VQIDSADDFSGELETPKSQWPSPKSLISMSESQRGLGPQLRQPVTAPPASPADRVRFANGVNPQAKSEESGKLLHGVRWSLSAFLGKTFPDSSDFVEYEG
jgi:hypothetical protein